jgi:hypothetical protein
MRSSGYIRAIVAAQMLAQIGAFALPALLPGYIERWTLSKTEAGWLVGIFFAAYVVMVPVLVALTDRIPVRREYLLGTGLTAISHFGFALLAASQGFAARACRHRLGRHLHAGAQGDCRPARRRRAITRRLVARRRRRHLGRRVVCDSGRSGTLVRPRCGFSARRRDRACRHAARRPDDARDRDETIGTSSLSPAPRLPAGAAQPRRDGLDVGYTVHTWEWPCVLKVTFSRRRSPPRARRIGS